MSLFANFKDIEIKEDTTTTQSSCFALSRGRVSYLTEFRSLVVLCLQDQQQVESRFRIRVTISGCHMSHITDEVKVGEKNQFVFFDHRPLDPG